MSSGFCSRCCKRLPLTSTGKTSIARLCRSCQVQKSPSAQPEARRKNGRDRKRAKVYYSTPKGKAKRAWNNIKERVAHADSYKHVEIRMTQEEFERWFLKELTKWEKEFPNEKPSVDRIKSKGHCELGNLRMVSLDENRQRNKRNKHRNRPWGTLWCPLCKEYLPRNRFYERLTIPKSKRMHWSNECKECISLKNKKQRPEPSGKCELCGRELPLLPNGNKSRTKHCANCRQKASYKRKHARA